MLKFKTDKSEQITYEAINTCYNIDLHHKSKYKINPILNQSTCVKDII